MFNNYSTSSTDIMGYSFNTENFCPSDIAAMFGTAPGQSADEAIAAYAKGNGINPESRVSTELPQPIFGNQTGDDRCARCHELLSDS